MLKPILLVEDNPNDIELALVALEKSNLANEVVVVRDGADALDYLHRRGAWTNRMSGNPAVVLLDLKMPRVDGLEVLREMRATPDLKNIPTVMLTTSREQRDLSTSYEQGVNAYVVKPIDFREFIRVIADLGMFWALVNEPPPGSVKLSRVLRED